MHVSHPFFAGKMILRIKLSVCWLNARITPILCRENGFEDKIVLIKGRVEEVELPVETVGLGGAYSWTVAHYGILCQCSLAARLQAYQQPHFLHSASPQPGPCIMFGNCQP